MNRIPGPGGALLEGVVLGNRRRLADTVAEDDFRTLGLTHLVAVSGSHLALACGAVALLGHLARLSRRQLILVTFLAGAAYAVVTGMPYSALRSLLMLASGGVAELIGRRSAAAGSLAVAVAAVLTWDPWAVFDVGFQLSAAAVGGLVLFGRLASDWVLSAFGGRCRSVAEAVGLTCVAQLATLPVSASTFGMVSVLAPVANVIVGPLVAASLWTGLASSVVASAMPRAGGVGLRAAAAVLGLAAAIAGALARVPGAAIVVSMSWPGVALLVGAIGLVWVRWPAPPSPRVARRALVVACAMSVALAVGPAPARDGSVCVLDVGQGDAILVRDSGRAMLVDTGPDPTVLRRALARHGLRRVDVLVLTHAHDDHTGGVPGLAGVVDVGQVAVSASGGGAGLPSGSLGRGLDVRTVEQGDRWRIGETEVVVAWPRAEMGPETAANDSSVVLYLRRGAFDAVLTGDAEALAQEGMAVDGFMTPVEVLKVPHHGSSNGLTEAALASWRPDVAVVSVGSDNEFGHPSPGTLSLLRKHGVVTWRTDECGEVTIRIGRHGYTVSGDRRAARGSQHSRACRLGERMNAPDEWYGVCVTHRVRTTPGGVNGSTTARGPETHIPHLWEGAAPSRARAPPSEGPCRSGRRPGLQLRHIRR
jgi:competence protein ComEC